MMLALPETRYTKRIALSLQLRPSVSLATLVSEGNNDLILFLLSRHGLTTVDKRQPPRQEAGGSYHHFYTPGAYDESHVGDAYVRTQCEYDTDDHDSKRVSKLVVFEEDVDPTQAVKAIEHTFYGRDDCWHEYDCCGCRTWHVPEGTIQQHGKRTYTCDVVTSYNY